MSTIKNRQELKTGLGILTTSVKDAWAKATEYAVAAVDHYHEGKGEDGKKHDTTWICDVQDAFLDMDVPFHKCFFKFLLEATNVRLRMDTDDLDSRVTATTRGNRPVDSLAFIDSVKKHTLVKYHKADGRTENNAKLVNRDGVKLVKEDKNKASSTTGLAQSETGKMLLDAAGLCDQMAGKQKKDAEAAVDWFNGAMTAIKAGEPMPLTIPTDLPDTDLARGAVESAQKLVDMARASGEDKELDEKLEKIVVDTSQQFTKPLAIAIGILAKRAPDESSDDDELPAAANG